MGTASTFFSMVDSLVERISAGLGVKGYLDCRPQKPDYLVPYEMYGLVIEVQFWVKHLPC